MIRVPICWYHQKYLYISLSTTFDISAHDSRLFYWCYQCCPNKILLLLKSKYWHGIYGSGYWVRKTCQQNWVPIRNKSIFNSCTSGRPNTSHALRCFLWILKISLVWNALFVKMCHATWSVVLSIVSAMQNIQRRCRDYEIWQWS